MQTVTRKQDGSNSDVIDRYFIAFFFLVQLQSRRYIRRNMYWFTGKRTQFYAAPLNYLSIINCILFIATVINS